MNYDLSFDRSLAWYRGDSVRYLRLHITAPPPDTSLARQPKNLAIALDRSGSMEGQPLRIAKQAVETAVNMLAPGDYFTLVAFDDEIEVVADAIPVQAGSADQIIRLLNSIPARGSTDIAKGWLTAARCAAARMDQAPQHQHHVIVLSDGQANHGEVHPDRLGDHALQLHQRGISSSAIGIGEGYSQTQLKPIATSGGGNLHDAQHPHEIAEVLEGEMAGLLNTAATDLEWTLTLPDGVEAECLNRFPVRQSPGKIRVNLGMVRSGSQRDAVLLLKLPSAALHSTLDFPARLNWRDNSGQRQSLNLTPAAIQFASGTQNNAQPRNIPLSERVASLWFANLLDQIIEQNRRSDFAATEQLLAQQAKRFTRYVEDLPSGPRLLEELQRVQRGARQGWNERKRKEIALFSRIAFSLSPDQRRTSRGDLANFLPD